MNSMMVDELAGKRVVILGLARQGVAMARYAYQAGAHVIASDIRSAGELEENLESVSDLSIELVLEEHPLILLEGVDVLVISGGVPADLPIVKEAQRRGILVTNDSLEFIKRAPCRVIGITGSAGKTTTTALTGAMVEESGRKTWIGGNIGRPLLTELPNMSSTDIVVQELSSFQLEMWTQSPPVSAVLNITPNHLDRHSDMDDYLRAKANILRFQSEMDIAVLSADDPGARNINSEVVGRLRTFSLENQVTDGAFVEGESLLIRDELSETVVCGIDQIPLRGRHNISNVLAAITLADSVGASPSSIKDAIANFNGVPHRLELVSTINNVQYINDSIATAPERALAALDSFSEPVILLAGGRDKDMVWDEWARRVLIQTRSVVLFGELAPLLERKLMAATADSDTNHFQSIRTQSMEEAVTVASQISEPGDVVLLAPGGTSFDSFVDFEARGVAFRQLVHRLSQQSKTKFSPSASIDNHLSLSN
jgi:UDP-N-acetylmuramoylalanine--D-glutamate ligase